MGKGGIEEVLKLWDGNEIYRGTGGTVMIKAGISKIWQMSLCSFVHVPTYLFCDVLLKRVLINAFMKRESSLIHGPTLQAQVIAQQLRSSRQVDDQPTQQSCCLRRFRIRLLAALS